MVLRLNAPSNPIYGRVIARWLHDCVVTGCETQVYKIEYNIESLAAAYNYHHHVIIVMTPKVRGWREKG